MGAMARLQLARALALSGDIVKAKSAYKDLLTLWEHPRPQDPYRRTSSGGTRPAVVIRRTRRRTASLREGTVCLVGHRREDSHITMWAVAFETDAFISYAHLDDVSLTEGNKGWVANLHRALETKVSQLLGRRARFWRDPKLAGNDVLNDALIEQLRKVAALISILSPGYLRSESGQELHGVLPRL